MNNYFRWKDIVVYHTFNIFILGGSFRIRYIVLKISSGRSKCFGCDIFAKPMFFWAWLSAKPKLFELDMFARLTLPWGWLNAKSRLFKSDMFTRCMLSWVWLTIKSNFFFYFACLPDLHCLEFSWLSNPYFFIFSMVNRSIWCC
jgi:hypothetical protein